MSPTEATINLTADWLVKHKTVVFTNRSKDQPLMSDPFPIYQQVVRDNPVFFKEVYGYVPDPNTKTGPVSQACDRKSSPKPGVIT